MTKKKQALGLNRRLFIRMCVGVAMAAAVVSSNWFFPKISLAEDEEIRIGVITEMSGPASTVGVEQMHGNEVAVEMWNKRGGVLGKEIKLFKEDSESKKDVGLLKARRLVERHKVHYLTGVCYSSIAMAIQPYARDNKILFVFQAGGNDTVIEYPHCDRYFFKAMFSAKAGAITIQEPAKRLGKRWYFTADNYSYGKLCVEYTTKAIKLVRPDMEVGGEDYTNFGEVNYAPYITKIIAARPDGVNVQQFGMGWQRVIKQLRQMGYKGHIHHGFFSYGDALATGDAVLGMTAAAPFIRENPEVPEAKAFSDAFKEKFGYYPGWAGAAGFNGMDMLLKGVEAAGTTDTEAVVDALESMKFKSILSPTYYFRKADHGAMMDMYACEVVKDPEYKYSLKILKKYAHDASPFITPDDQTGCEENMKRRD
jgi:branched-chain amino acid transport system substrate-binding protein